MIYCCINLIFQLTTREILQGYTLKILRLSNRLAVGKHPSEEFLNLLNFYRGKIEQSDFYNDRDAINFE